MYDVSRTIVDDRLRQAEQARLVRQARAHGRQQDEAERRAALTAVGRLLERVEELVVRDDAAWSELRSEARALTGRLHAADLLPRHLVVAPEERPVVVTRVLVAAARRLQRAAR